MLTSVTENNGYACIFHGLSLTLQKIKYGKHNEIRYIRG